MAKKEKDFKADFRAKLKKLHCDVLQYKQDATTLVGFPDTIVLLPEAAPVFIEFKKTKTSPYRPGQKEWIKKLNDRCYFAYVVYPENADEILEEIAYLARK